MLSGKYECFGCGEVFDGLDALRHHEREDHEGEGETRESRTRGDRTQGTRTRGAP